MADDDILTIKEVAEYLKLTERTLYRLVQDGQVPGFKVGNSWRFKRGDIERWIEDQKKRLQRPGGGLMTFSGRLLSRSAAAPKVFA